MKHCIVCSAWTLQCRAHVSSAARAPTRTQKGCLEKKSEPVSQPLWKRCVPATLMEAAEAHRELWMKDGVHSFFKTALLLSRFFLKLLAQSSVLLWSSGWARISLDGKRRLLVARWKQISEHIAPFWQKRRNLWSNICSLDSWRLQTRCKFWEVNVL